MISVLTIVRNRAGHLAQLVEGLRRSIEPPGELIVVDMGSEPPIERLDTDFPCHVKRLAAEHLPLAEARNLAARHARFENLLFLDVDCIPTASLIGTMDEALKQADALICAEILYLGPEDARGSWDEKDLAARGKPHAVRNFPEKGLRAEENPGLFWSLAFGIRRKRFDALGGLTKPIWAMAAKTPTSVFAPLQQGCRFCSWEAPAPSTSTIPALIRRSSILVTSCATPNSFGRAGASGRWQAGCSSSRRWA